MRIPAKLWRYVGIGLVVLVIVLLCVRTWVVPALIVRQIQARIPGKVTIRNWWIGRDSAGVVGLALHEGPSGGSPVWASADRVSTDLSLGCLLRGRFAPGRVTLEEPKITLRLDRRGELLTPFQMKSGGSSASALPVVVAKDARVTIRQDGRPEMVVTRVQGRLAPDADIIGLAARSDDTNWGPFEGYGRYDPKFQNGRVELRTTSGIVVDPRKVEQIPFVPQEVWTNVLPHGAVDVQLTVAVAPQKPIEVRTLIGLRQTTVKSTALDLTARNATGEVIVEGALVRLEHVAGEAIDGRIEAHGTMDFTKSPSRFNLGLNLKGINVADAPRSWQLYEAGVTGHLSGQAQLKVTLDSRGVDLSGSSGEAEVTGGAIQGIPVKSLKLVMHAQGDDLQFETKTPGASGLNGPLRRLIASSLSLLPSGSRGRFRSPATVLALEDLVALQAPPAEPGKARVKAESTPALEEPRPGGIKLPKAITTQIELQDVDIPRLLARVKFFLGAPVPLPITGKLSLKANATIPLGQLRSVKGYAFHGDLTLSGASIYKVDLGTVSARIDLANGVLELKDFRGHLVDRPNGGPDNPPEPVPPVSATGPLPPGAFRGTLRAEIAPPGRLSARFEGNSLPLGELAAPVLPRPTPVAGLVSLSVRAEADLARAAQPKAWSVQGTADSVHITYHGTMLDRVALRFNLQNGRLDVNDFAARLNGQPLTANVGIDLDAPHAFQGTVDVNDWDLAALEALVPSAPHPSPVAGTLTAHAEARGTLAPLKVQTQGQGQLGQFQAGPVPLGDVPFRWTTDRDAVMLSVIEARPFGGRLQAEARVPTVVGQATEGSATFTAIDTARITAAMPGQGLKLTGRASGKITFTIPSDVSRVEADVQLSAPDLTVQGVPAERVRAAVKAHKGKLTYEVTADSLGGKVKFQGDFPLTAAPAQASANGELRAAGFELADVWKAIGVTGAATRLAGLGAINANLRAARAGPDAGLWAHGYAEFRNLSWGTTYPLGQLRGVVALTPTVWRVEPLSGELLGGVANGFVWGTTPERGPKQLGFDFRIERASLPRALAFLPTLGKNIDGFGTLRLSGRLEEAFRASAEVDVGRARFLGLPLSELRAPAEVILTPGTGTGWLQVRRWSARFAGGQIRGDARFNIGEDRAFQGEVVLAAIDLESILLIESEVRRPASGKISGRITLASPSPALLARYRGKVDLDLTDASLVSIPVFREIDKFLGAARGGLFEDGDLTGTIANKQLVVEEFTLVGRLVQLHTTGTVGFDGQLNLEVLINTNQTIPETGHALVTRIPGLGPVLGRSEKAMLQVASFLSNRLLKLRVTGTIRNPSVSADPTILVTDTAVAFFSGVLKLPLGFLK